MTDDTAARDAALEAAESIILQAPAGSGKTEVLTQRYLRLLAVVDEPEEILAITFTRKAAAEMRRRILRVLDGDIDPSRPTAGTLATLREGVLANAARRGWDALELRTRLRIQTIDSLNHELARAMPLLGRSLAGLEIAADPEALHREAARLALHDAESEPTLQASMDLIFGRLDNNWGQAESLLASMLANRAQWLRTVASTPPEVLGAAVERSLESIVRAALRSLASQLPPGASGQATTLLRQTARWRHENGQPTDRQGRRLAWSAWLEADAALEVDPAQLASWQAFADLLLNADDDWRRRFTIREGGVAPKQEAAKAAAQALLGDCAAVPGLREALALVRALPPPRLGPDEVAALAALARLLRHASAALRVCFAAAGRVDHTEVAFVARNGLRALGHPSELALRRAAALKHLLLDEFQDTSVEQGELIESLVVGWAAGDGRSAFVVGDPMQSIYQFRNAEVGLFLRARERGIGDLPLRALALTRNFRSAPPLIDWCNRAFATIFPARDELRESAVRFLSSSAGRGAPAIDESGVRVHRLATDSPQQEARLLARAVLEARALEAGCERRRAGAGRDACAADHRGAARRGARRTRRRPRAAGAAAGRARRRRARLRAAARGRSRGVAFDAARAVLRAHAGGPAGA